MANGKLPYIQWYVKDYLGDPNLQACSLASRGLWTQLLNFMHDSPERGTIFLKTPFRTELPNLSNLDGFAKAKLKQDVIFAEVLLEHSYVFMRNCGATLDEIHKCLLELFIHDVFDLDVNGTIISRRMKKDDTLRVTRQNAGSAGGSATQEKRKKDKKPARKKIISTSAQVVEGEKLSEQNDFALAKSKQNPINTITSIDTNTNTNTNTVASTTTGGEKFSLYKEAIAVYDQWLVSLTGLKGKYNGGEGAAMKGILEYLLKLPKINGDEHEALNAWRLILQHWGRLNPYLQSRKKLVQINSEFVNIIDQIKNGRPATQPAIDSSHSVEGLTSAIEQYLQGS